MLVVLKRLAAVFLIACASVVPAVAAPAAVMAATNPYEGVCKAGGAGSPVCATTTNDPIAGPQGAIVRVTSILAAVAGMVAVIFLVYGGFKYITSGGDSGGTAAAKSTIIAALVGLLIALLARPIVLFVISRVGS